MDSNSVDITKPIEVKPGRWQEVEALFTYVERTKINGIRYNVVRIEWDNGNVRYDNYTDDRFNYIFRNIPTLADRCREELKGATEVRVWGADVQEQGAICKSYINSLGIRNVICGVFYDNEYGTHSDGQFDCNYSAHITPVTWTPEEAAKLAQELGLLNARQCEPKY